MVLFNKERGGFLGFGRKEAPRKTQEELLFETYLALRHKANPVLSGARQRSVLFVEKKGELFYPALNPETARYTSEKINAIAFLEMAYGYLDVLGRDPDIYEKRELIPMGNEVVLPIMHPPQKADGFPILARHIFDLEGKELRVENLVCRATMASQEQIILPQNQPVTLEAAKSRI